MLWQLGFYVVDVDSGWYRGYIIIMCYQQHTRRENTYTHTDYHSSRKKTFYWITERKEKKNRCFSRMMRGRSFCSVDIAALRALFFVLHKRRRCRCLFAKMRCKKAFKALKVFSFPSSLKARAHVGHEKKGNKKHSEMMIQYRWMKAKAVKRTTSENDEKW